VPPLTCSITSCTRAPVATSKTCTSPRSLPPRESETAMRGAIGRGTNQSIAMPPSASIAAGIDENPCGVGSSSELSATRKGCSRGGRRSMANVVARAAPASDGCASAQPSSSRTRLRMRSRFEATPAALRACAFCHRSTRAPQDLRGAPALVRIHDIDAVIAVGRGPQLRDGRPRGCGHSRRRYPPERGRGVDRHETIRRPRWQGGARERSPGGGACAPSSKDLAARVDARTGKLTCQRPMSCCAATRRAWR